MVPGAGPAGPMVAARPEARMSLGVGLVIAFAVVFAGVFLFIKFRSS